MKTKVLSVLLAVLTVLSLSVCAFAEQPRLYNVMDHALLLTDEEEAVLEESTAQLSERFGIGVYIVTIDDFHSLGEDDVYVATYELYHKHAMGEGEDRSGIILLLSMAERDFAIFRYGERAEYVFNPYGMEKLEDSFLPSFAEDDWYGGFTGYVEACEQYLALAENGDPVRKSPVGLILLFSVIALVIAGVVVLVLVKMMKSVATASAAAEYISGELQLTDRTDTFTHSTESRRKIQSKGSFGSGGSKTSTARTGGGGAGRSGKF